MYVNRFLRETAYIEDMDICGEAVKVYKSKFDDSYITHVGMEKDVRFLAKREITGQLTHGVGFSPKDNMWYGWSHRAIYGFCIGSTCKKGDSHYRANNEQDEIEAAIRFWSDEDNSYVKAEKIKDGELRVTWLCNGIDEIHSASWHYDYESFGRGEWVAKTMDDAKIMAQDFNNGVS